MKIRLKVLSLIFAVTLFAGGLTILLVRGASTSIVKEEISDHLQSIAQSRAHHIEATVEYHTGMIELFAEEVRILTPLIWTGMLGDSESLAASTDAISAMMSAVAASNKHIDTALVLIGAGEVIASSDPFVYPFRTDALQSSEVFSRGLEGSFIDAFDVAEADGRFVLCAAAPFPIMEDASLMGVVVFLGGEDGLLQTTMDTTGLGDTGEVYIVDEHGFMVTSPPRFDGDAFMTVQVDMADIEEALSYTTLDEAGVPGRDVVSAVNYEGKRVLRVCEPLQGTEWTMVVEKAHSEAFAPVTRLTNMMLWAFLGVVMVGALASVVLSRAISRPIVKLHEGAEEIIGGNWDHDVATSAKDEVGELSRALSRMTANLRESQGELQKYSTSLEDKVLERTKALADVNEELSKEVAERKTAQVALKKAHDGLETRVQQRTAELARANEGLQAEIGERERAEAQTQKSLREKEVLLKEIHHRVKNNLQVISSLLSLQSENTTDGDTLEMFKESQDRVRSMALVHESLYRSSDLARIDFSEYVQSLANHLHRTYGAGMAGVVLRVDAENVSLGIDAAIPCGLIINELLTNSLKYAFPKTQSPGEGRNRSEIRVGIARGTDQRFTLTVSDNGIGIPADLDIRETESLGLQLVCTLTDQLRGTIEVQGNGGTTFTITFAESASGKGAG